MSPDWIIVVGNPVRRLLFQVPERRPRAGMDQLLLIRREERFRYGIIVTDPCPSRERLILFCVQYSSNTEDVYWQPRSESDLSPAGGLRAAMAMSRAAMIRLVRICAGIAQPTTLRE